MSASANNEMYVFTTEAVLAAQKKLTDAEEELAKDGALADWYFTFGTVRMCHRDGWSPGYFRFEDNEAVFVPDYTEDLA